MSAGRTRQPGDFRTGIAIPLLRSLALVALLLAAALLASEWGRDDRWFYAVFAAGIVALWLLDRFIRPNRAAERAASRRWFGIEDRA